MKWNIGNKRKYDALPALIKARPSRPSLLLFTRVRVLVAALVIAGSFVAQVAQSPMAHAAEPTFDEMKGGSFIASELSGKVLDHQLYYFLVACSTIDVDKVTEDELKAWKFFSRSDFSAGGSHTDDRARGAMYDNDIVDCGEGKWVQEAFGRFGFTEPYEAFCSLDFTYSRNNGGNGKDGKGGHDTKACTDGRGQGDFDGSGSENDQAKAMEKLLKSTPKGPTAAGALKPEEEYVRYYRSFMNACKPTFVRAYGDGAGAEGNDRAFKIPVVTQAGNLGYVYATTSGDVKDGTRFPLVATTSGTTTWKTCGEAAVKLREVAGAYADWVAANQDADGDNSVGPTDDPSDGEDTTSCAVEGVGWMICPVVTFLGKITDQMYDLLADNLLKVQAGEIFDTGGGTYKAWSTIRNIANVAFVLAFLFVIYSQITGAGLSNYGIKKMLPKIVIAAILVNVSFWVCAVAVDVSNILGYSLKEFFDPSNSNFSYTITADGVTKTGNGWTGLAVAVVATAALVYIGLSVLLPALVVVALAVLTVVTVLAVRQALIILLIVVSPLAFVAYLLPNTEEWFKKWLSLFKTMLLVFPIISVVFGASALASKVVMDAAQGNVFVSIVGALISIVPLFITPIIMKSAGGVLNRIGGVINNPNKGPFDRMRKGAEGYRKNRQEYRNLKSMNGYRSLPGRGTFSRMGSRRKAVLDNRKSELNRANASYVADLAENNSGFRKSLARGGGDGSDMRALAGAINVQTKLSIDEVNAASAVIENLNLPSNQLNDLAKGHDVAGLEGGNEATRRAAIKSALKKATVADAEDIIKSSGTMTDAQRQDVVDGLVSNGITSKATHLGGKTLEDIAQGNVTSEADLDEAVAYHFNKGKYSAEALVSQDGASAERVHRVAAAGTTSKGTVIDSTQKATVKVEAAKVKTDPRLNTRISSDQARTALSGLETM